METDTVQPKQATQTRSRGKRMIATIAAFAVLMSGMAAFTGGDSPLGPVADEVAEAAGLETTEASATASGCTWARYGSVCLWVDGDGTTVDGMHAAYFKTGKAWDPQVCRPSVWFYAVYPNGQVSGLKWEQRSSCSFGSAWFNKIYSPWRYGGKHFPHGTRICVEIKEQGTNVGGEPCITVRR